VKNVEDLEKLEEIPFHLDPKSIEPFIDDFRARYEELGDLGIMRIEYPSPIVAISANLSFENFLALSIMKKDLLHRLLEEITGRLLTITDVIFADKDIDTLVNLGGSEQCTPPLMAPEAFDEFVVPYDGQIIRCLKSYGIPVNMHCHGNVRHALKCMVEMGVDSTDPVEPPPAGDVTFAAARMIADRNLTQIGNLEFNELENQDRDHIRKRVQEILSLGKERLILSASAGPISAVTPRLVDNYKTWIDTYLQLYS
jgi:uroporphyrinogen-III decarboxylase